MIVPPMNSMDPIASRTASLNSAPIGRPSLRRSATMACSARRR